MSGLPSCGVPCPEWDRSGLACVLDLGHEGLHQNGFATHSEWGDGTI